MCILEKKYVYMHVCLFYFCVKYSALNVNNEWIGGMSTKGIFSSSLYVIMYTCVFVCMYAFVC